MKKNKALQYPFFSWIQSNSIQFYSHPRNTRRRKTKPCNPHFSWILLQFKCTRSVTITYRLFLNCYAQSEINDITTTTRSVTITFRHRDIDSHNYDSIKLFWSPVAQLSETFGHGANLTFVPSSLDLKFDLDLFGHFWAFMAEILLEANTTHNEFMH